MAFFQVLVLGVVGGVGAAPATLRKLPDRPGGRVLDDGTPGADGWFLSVVKYKCLDGTPGAYWFDKAPAAAGDNAKKWIVYLPGGGECGSIDACKTRSGGSKGSSKNYKDKDLSRLVSNSATENPYFYTWNHVEIGYCSGDMYSGDAEKEVEGLWFQGHRIVKGVINTGQCYMLRKSGTIFLLQIVHGFFPKKVQINIVANFRTKHYHGHRGPETQQRENWLQ